MITPILIDILTSAWIYQSPYWASPDRGHNCRIWFSSLTFKNILHAHRRSLMQCVQNYCFTTSLRTIYHGDASADHICALCAASALDTWMPNEFRCEWLPSPRFVKGTTGDEIETLSRSETPRWWWEWWYVNELSSLTWMRPVSRRVSLPIIVIDESAYVVSA